MTGSLVVINMLIETHGFNWSEPERAPNLAILLGPHVCIIYVCIYYSTYVLPNLGTKFCFCVLQYSRHVPKMASVLSAEYAVFEIGSCGAQRARHLDKSVLPRAVYYSSKVDGVRLPYALVAVGFGTSAAK